MQIFKLARRYFGDDSGAVTVDWVVLTAAVCGLVAVAMAGLKGNMTTVGQNAADFLSSNTISSSF